MSQDLQSLFTTHKAAFDSQEAPSGHQNRFMQKLHSQQKKNAKKKRWLQPLAIAATFLVLVAIGSMIFNMPTTSPEDLASVSPEMEQTQSFFTTTINQELQKLTAINDPELTELITETLKEIEVLESQYNLLKEDLRDSGQDNRVIAAMISNFQDRIALLEHVSETIEEIQTLKNNTNEITL